MKKEERAVRQGDVYLKPVLNSDEIKMEDLEKVEKFQGDTVLAFGEATGHAHRIRHQEMDVEFYREKSTNKMYLIVNNDCKLTHEEHGPIDIKKSTKHEVRIHRVYTPQGIVPVAD